MNELTKLLMKFLIIIIITKIFFKNNQMALIFSFQLITSLYKINHKNKYNKMIKICKFLNCWVKFLLYA